MERRIQKEFYGYSMWSHSFPTGKDIHYLGAFRDRRAADRSWAKLTPCPRCLDTMIPKKGCVGVALSRADNATRICSPCGTVEALLDYYGRTR